MDMGCRKVLVIKMKEHIIGRKRAREGISKAATLLISKAWRPCDDTMCCGADAETTPAGVLNRYAHIGLTVSRKIFSKAA
jgi:hypothetical protein